MRARSVVYFSDESFRSVVLGPMIGDLLSVPSDFLMHHICQIVSEAPDRIDRSLPSVRCSLFSVVHLYYYQFIAVVVLRLERQQIRVSDVLSSRSTFSAVRCR